MIFYWFFFLINIQYFKILFTINVADFKTMHSFVSIQYVQCTLLILYFFSVHHGLARETRFSHIISNLYNIIVYIIMIIMTYSTVLHMNERIIKYIF